jgi:hypothetical protein
MEFNGPVGACACTPSAPATAFVVDSPSIHDLNGMRIAGFHAGAAAIAFLCDFDFKAVNQRIDRLYPFRLYIPVSLCGAAAITAETDSAQCVVIRGHEEIIVPPGTTNCGYEAVIYGSIEMRKGRLFGNGATHRGYDVKSCCAEYHAADVMVVFLAVVRNPAGAPIEHMDKSGAIDEFLDYLDGQVFRICYDFLIDRYVMEVSVFGVHKGGPRPYQR